MTMMVLGAVFALLLLVAPAPTNAAFGCHHGHSEHSVALRSEYDWSCKVDAAKISKGVGSASITCDGHILESESEESCKADAAKVNKGIGSASITCYEEGLDTDTRAECEEVAKRLNTKFLNTTRTDCNKAKAGMTGSIANATGTCECEEGLTYALSSCVTGDTAAEEEERKGYETFYYAAAATVVPTFLGTAAVGTLKLGPVQGIFIAFLVSSRIFDMETDWALYALSLQNPTLDPLHFIQHHSSSPSPRHAAKARGSAPEKGQAAAPPPGHPFIRKVPPLRI